MLFLSLRWHSCSEGTITLTPTAGSGASRYKIPDNLDPSGICCITVPVPNDREYIAQFMGAIWRMSLQTHYERDEGHSAVTVAALWRGIWKDLQVSACCGNLINDVTINIELNTQAAIYLFELNQLYIAAGLDVDVAFPGIPALYDSDPGDAGAEIAQRNRALCLAVESLVNTIFNRAISWLQSQTEEVAGLLVGAVAIPWISTPFTVGAIIIGLVAAGEVLQELVRPAYRAYVACGIFTALKGEDPNLKQKFFEAADNLPARPPPPENPLQDAARDVIEIWLRSQLNNTENYLSFVKDLRAAMDMAVSLTDQDCGCLELLIEDTDGFTFTSPQVIEHLGGTSWRVTAGLFDHPSEGSSDVIHVQRVGGACFTVTNVTLISGDLSRTTWKPCGGAPTFTDNPVPLNKANLDTYSLSDLGRVNGFVVEFDAIEP